MVDGEEDVVPRFESPWPTEESAGQGSQLGPAVRLRAGADAGRPVGASGGAAETAAGCAAQRPPPAQQPPRRPDPAVALPEPPGAGEGRQRQVQVSQAKEEEEEEAEVQAGREAGAAVSNDGRERDSPG